MIERVAAFAKMREPCAEPNAHHAERNAIRKNSGANTARTLASSATSPYDPFTKVKVLRI